MRLVLLVLVTGVLIPPLVACCGSSSPASDAGTETASDSDSDADSDSDTDSDTDDSECPNPGIEQDGAGLLWQQCLAGQCLTEDADSGVSECTGEPLELTWDEAQEGCTGSWRLPTRDELMQLLGNCGEMDTDAGEVTCDTCFESPACDAIYPGIEDLPDLSRLHLHWSSDEFDVSNSWFARFKHGVVKKDSKSKSYTIVCTREAD